MAESVKKPRVAKSKTNDEADAKSGKTRTEKATGSARPTPNNGSEPTYEQIAELARNYWEQRGYADGHHEEDWFLAEKQLRAKAS
jgi:DUF2934 family protein